MIKKQNKLKNNGQVMLLTILIFGGAMITATIIAGTLTIQSIRQSTLAAESAKAIFAADAGVDFLWYRCREWVNPATGLTDGCDPLNDTFNTCDPAGSEFANGSCYIATYEKDPITLIYVSMRALGYSNRDSKLVARTLYVTF